MAEWGSEVLKNECLDLPPKIYEVVDVPMTDEQSKAYKTMRDYYAAEVNQELVTTDSALTKLTKLHQITTGHIIDEDGTTHRIKHNRLSILDNILEDLACKTIIFSKFVEPISELIEHLGERAVEYSGRIDADTREQAVDRFQSDPDCDIIVISLQSSGAYGLDLYAAGAVIYYSNGYSLERRMQSEDRAHRPGQANDKVVYIDMVATGTVDENVQQALTDKIDVASQVTGLMGSWLR
jgi:SNF2 family DNA or RNA helicase